MKLHFDEKADALYLRLDDAPVIDSRRSRPGSSSISTIEARWSASRFSILRSVFRMRTPGRSAWIWPDPRFCSFIPETLPCRTCRVLISSANNPAYAPSQRDVHPVRVRMSHMVMSAGGPCLDPKWYLVKTKALNETRVHRHLTGAGYEVLFPKISRKSKRHRASSRCAPSSRPTSSSASTATS